MLEIILIKSENWLGTSDWKSLDLLTTDGTLLYGVPIPAGTSIESLDNRLI